MKLHTDKSINQSLRNGLLQFEKGNKKICLTSLQSTPHTHFRFHIKVLQFSFFSINHCLISDEIRDDIYLTLM